MRRVYIVLSAALLATMLVAFAVGSAGAQPVSKRYAAQAKDYWYAALAVAPSNWKYGGYGQGLTKKEAEKRAMYYCRSGQENEPLYRGDCQGAVWVKNGYMATAFEKTKEQPYKNLAWGSGWGHKFYRAKQEAKSVCYDYANEPCAIAQTAPSRAYDPSLPTKGGGW